MTDLDEFMAEAERADDYMEERRLATKYSPVPPDPEKWITDLETRVAVLLPRLPQSVQDEFAAMVAEQSKAARRWLSFGRLDEARIMLGTLHENYQRLLSNVDLRDAEPVRQGRSKGGKAEKRSQWADDLATHLVALGVSFPEAWSTIPEDENHPLEIDEDTGVYRSAEGDKVVAVDLINDKELSSLARSSFQKRYFSPAKQKADTN